MRLISPGDEPKLQDEIDYCTQVQGLFPRIRRSFRQRGRHGFINCDPFINLTYGES